MCRPATPDIKIGYGPCGRTGLRLPESAATIWLSSLQCPKQHCKTTPMTTLTFDDFPPGRFGSFDPQPMHLDEEAAAKSILKGLSGSGWHLCSIMMRMMCDGFIARPATLASPGVNEVRWLAPLRPGDDLTLDVDVLEARVSRSRPATGIVTFKSTARNAAGEALCEMTSPIIVGRRAGTEEMR